MSKMVHATTLDAIRIECVGEARAVTCPGRAWVDARDRLKDVLGEVESVLGQLDDLAQVWGDEGVFRRCRDRLRKLVTPGE